MLVVRSGCWEDGVRRVVSPVTHLLASWIIAAKTTDNQRDCRLVTLAGILPGVDGLGLGVDMAREALGYRGSLLFSHYHPYLFHGFPGGLLIAAVLPGFSPRL